MSLAWSLHRARRDQIAGEVRRELVAGKRRELTGSKWRELVVGKRRALAAAGRDTEALLAYEPTREALADLPGRVDSSPELSALHVALLRRSRRGVARGELTPHAQTGAPTGIVRAV